MRGRPRSRPSSPEEPPAPVLLCGGGPEGEIGDASAWSTAYGRILIDRDHDGRIEVAVLSAEPETGWLPRYFESLGADLAYDLTVDSRSAAADAADRVAGADAVFVKGGDQGVYCDLWNGTPLEDAIRRVHEGGGESAGPAQARCRSASTRSPEARTSSPPTC